MHTHTPHTLSLSHLRSHLQFTLEFLVVGVNGILAIISTPQQAVGHLNLQQVVQHLRLVPDGLHCVQQFDLAHAEVMRDQSVESVGGVHKLSLCASLVNKLTEERKKKQKKKLLKQSALYV